jgi:WD40 repeat protein
VAPPPAGGRPQGGAPGAAGPWPEGALARLGPPSPAPPARAASLAFSPDGRAVAAGCLDGSVRVYEVRSGAECCRHEGHRGPARAVAFTPDGRAAASGGADGAIDLWGAADGKTFRRLTGHRGAVRCVAVSPDGRVVGSKADDQTIRLWDLASGRELRRLGERYRDAGFNEPSCPLAFSPDGKAAASASGFEGAFPNNYRRTVRLWDVGTGAEVRSFAGGTPSFAALAFAPDGRAVAAGMLNRPGLRLWEAAGGRELAGAWAAPREVTALAFAPDGRSLAAADGASGRVAVWEVATGGERCRFETGEPGLRSLAFAPDGSTVAAPGAGGAVLLWDVTGLRGAGRPPPEGVTAGQLESLWSDLQSAEASKASRAVWRLAGVPGLSVRFVRARLGPVRAPGNIADLLRDLDSGEFAVRDGAARELKALGEAAVPALRRALGRGPSPEVRRQVERLLEGTEGRLRWARALEMLEHAGTADAREVLAAVAGGDPEARPTQEARAALQRLARASGRP